MHIGVIGAGTMGLTLAYRLGAAGHRVTVLEAAPQMGGLATWFDYGDFVWDKYYHVICRQDSQLLALIDELALAPELRWTRTKTGFLWRGRLISMSNTWEFLTFPPLSLLDKIRLARGIIHCTRIKDATHLEKTKATDWLTAVFGKSVYEVVWEPLLESKYGAVKDMVPATIMWATITRYYATRSKGAGREQFGFLTRGFKTLYDALSRAIAERGGEIRCGVPVAAIDTTDPAAVIVKAGSETLRFDRLISTLPTALLRRVAPHLTDLFQQEAAPPRFLGVVCMALVLRKPLSPYYVTNLIQRGMPFTGIIEVSNLTGCQLLNGGYLTMLPRYDVPESPWFERDGEEIAREFLAALKPIWPDVEDNIVRHFVHRERRIQALWIDAPPPPVHAPRRTSDGRVWSVNAELAGRDTLNNNAIVRVANEAAQGCFSLWK
jgi:protoporphyrinogen oxidase